MLTNWAAVSAIASAAAMAAIIGLIILRLRRRRELMGMDAMLDAALNGTFTPEKYDEGQISKLEAKLARYLSTAKLRRGHLEAERAQIHTLISDISHQTKTPIANIQLYAQLLCEQPELSEESHALAARLTASAEKLSFLIRALIRTSRLESGIIRLQPVPGDLYALIARAAAEYRTKAAQKAVSLRLPEESPEIRACFDPKWCAEAIGNLLDNAIKYTPPGGEIVVRLQDYEMFACVRVEDSGKGISEADLPRIFGRFYRSADSAGDEGIGIGLTLAREIVQKCGGYIQATSAPGRGSIFSVYLSKS